MTAVWLVRHGEAAASWGQHPDPGLSELGWTQARDLASQLSSDLPERTQLISSPKQRARETAQPLSDALGTEIAIVDAFREIQAPVPLAERQDWLRTFMRQSWADQPATLWHWRRDIVDALLALERPTVVFTHFLVINAVVAEISGEPETLQVWPDNGSSHRFVIEQGALKLVSLGAQMKTRVN